MTEPPTAHVTLGVEMADGQTHTLELQGPGGVLKISVGQPGYHAAVWRIWANPRSNDVYVGAHQLMKTKKFSLHGTGDWRHQWETTQLAYENTGNQHRIIDQWSRPAPDKVGWTKALSMITPTGQLCPVPDDPPELADEVLWLPDAQPDRAWGFHVVIAEPDKGEQALQGLVPVGGFTLANGDGVLVLVNQQPLAGEEWERICKLRVDNLATLQDDPDYVTAESLRMAVYVYNATQDRLVYDLAAKPISGR